MKKVLAITIVAALMLCATAAFAGEGNWQLILKASDLDGTKFNVNTSIGCQATFTDGQDTAKGEAAAPSNPAGGSTIGTVAALQGEALTTRDFKQPITEVGSTAIKTWTIKLYGLDNAGPGLAGLKLLVTLGSSTVAPVYVIGGEPYAYTFEAPFIPGGKQVFDAQNPMPASFSYTADTVLGSANAYTMTVTAAPVPEPSSMLALASGLFGLAGFAVRRRK